MTIKDKDMKAIDQRVKEQVIETVTEKSKYSTVWNDKRVIIDTGLYGREVVTITVAKETEEFSYSDVDKASNYILERL